MVAPDAIMRSRAIDRERHGRPAGAGARLMSLDVFRGATIAAMILVNNPGTWSHVHRPLLHAEWHGWTFTDLVFPFFLFIVGVSLVYSLEGRRSRGDAPASVAAHIVRRSALIFAIGLFLNAFPFFDLARVRVPGVLQRISLCYLGAALVTLRASRSGRAWTAGALLAAYWALMTLVPVPGFGAGRLDPDGNLAAYIDRLILEGHLWRPAWDPEGLLSTLPAIATALLGTLAGDWLRAGASPARTVTGLAAAGAIGLLAGSLLDIAFPINKNLWTSSYVVFTGGMAALVLGACVFVVDVKGWRRIATPLVALGMNPLALFALSSLLAKASVSWKTTMPDGRLVFWKTWMFERLFAPLASPINASLLFAVSYVLVFLAIATVLYRRRMFIKI